MPQTQVLSASTVMDQAAVLMNDAAKSIYPYSIQIPYLNMSLQELQEYFELNNVPVTDTVTGDVIIVLSGTTFVVPPHDLTEPKIVWESESGLNRWTRMARLDSLPRYAEDTEVSYFGCFVYQDQKIKFLASNRDNDIKIDYTKALFSPIVNSSDGINVINAATFLEYRTAALLAEFCGENPTRAESLNSDATIALDRALGIGTKGRQAISTRRRPFRSGYKNRNGM